MQMDFKPWQVDPTAQVERDLRASFPARPLGVARLGVGLLFLVVAMLAMPLYWLGLGLFVAVSAGLGLIGDLVAYGAEVTVGRPTPRMR